MATDPRRGLFWFCVALVERFDEDRGFQTAGSLAFTTLLAIVPTITVALALASAFPLFDELVEALRKLAIEHLLPQTGGVASVTDQLEVFRANAAGLTALGLGFLAVTAIMLLLTVDDVFNRIFRVEQQRRLVRRVTIHAVVLAIGPVLIGGALYAVTYIVAHSLGKLREVDAITGLVLASVPFAFTFVALVLLYMLVPYRTVAPRHAIAGAVTAGLAFEVAKYGFGLYVAKFPTYAMIYGAFAVLPIFLLWVYVSWVVVLGGAIITAMLGERGAEA
jgi:membrane protein